MFLPIMAETGDSSGSMRSGGSFPTTHWSVVLVAAQAGTPQANQALQNWVWALLGQVLMRLRADEEAAGRGALFERLKPTLMGERLTLSYGELAAGFKTTEEALRMAALRLRRRFRKLLREEVAPTVARPEEIDDEIRHLFAALGR